MNITRKLMNREVFVGLFIASVGGVGSIVVGLPIIGVRPRAHSSRQPKDLWRDVGAVDDFKVGETVQVNYNYNQGAVQQWSGPTQETAAWLRRNSAELISRHSPSTARISAARCTGSSSQNLPVPCHGSVFNGDGTVAGGPAPRPLFTVSSAGVKTGESRSRPSPSRSST